MELHVTSYLTRVILSYADIRAVEGKKKKGKKKYQSLIHLSNEK